MAHFNLSLMKKRANYSPAMRTRFPRVSIDVDAKISQLLIIRWAIVIVKTARHNGILLNVNTGKAMAYYAIDARANGMTYAEAVLFAISKYQ